MTKLFRNDEAATDDLVVRSKTEREAFGALYDRFFPLVHRYCHRRLFDAATAEDVSSEVFLHVARTIRRFPGTTEEDFRRWVYRIATNAINAHLRQKTRRHDLLNRAMSVGLWTKVEAIAERQEFTSAEWEAVASALAHLNPREQAVLTLRFIEGLSYEQVADILDVRVATLRVVASRAIKNLRARLPSDFGLPSFEQQVRRSP
jgi:RNA polymerase sigma-70 factor (ECF subfamily)